MAKRKKGSGLESVTPAERDAYWLQHFRAIEAEGIPMRVYAEREGLGVHTVYAAKKRLVKRGVSPRTRVAPKNFARVRVLEEPSRSPCCRFRIGPHAIVEWEESPSIEMLSALLNAVTSG